MIQTFFPFVRWFEGYSKSDFRTDFIAGLTVALVLIPQSMAYAQLAGLPAYYGLYASFLPPMIAALFGSSRQLATGPVAVVSLMTSASLSPLATAGSEGYVAYAMLLAFMVGIFQFALGILRLGLVVNLLSHPVVNGFTNAAAIIIASSQLSKMFGVYVDSAPHHYETIVRVIQAALHYTHWPSLLMGVFAFAIMYGLKKVSPRIPNVLVAVVFTTILSWAIDFEHNRSLPLTAIQSEAAWQTVEHFNRAISEMDAQARERMRATEALSDAHREDDPLAVLNAQHAADLACFRVDQLKEQAHGYREELRGFLFRGAPQPDGTLQLFLAADVPADVKHDGRLWRIKVGNDTLNVEGITITGGGAVVGTIPKGLPTIAVPRMDLGILLHLFPFAAIISLLGFMEAISIAKAMAGKTGQRLNPNQELIGQGLANILGAMSKSYPTSGSFSRSAVNLQAGAISGLSSVFTSLAVVIVLLFFTPLLYHLPQAVLAAIIMMAVIGLVNVSGFVHAWYAKWYDGVISVITFVSTLAYAPHLDRGIMIGVVLSLLVFFYNTMHPKVVSLARAQDAALRCATTHGLRECEYIAMVRFDGPLFFANSSYLEDKIMSIMRAKKKLRHIIIVANGINDIDASGEEGLSLLVDRVRSAGVDISLSGVNETVMSVFNNTHFPEKLGNDHLFPTMEKAIQTVHESSHKNADEDTCPLLTTCHFAHA